MMLLGRLSPALYRSSCVVTIFSISELSRASCRVRVLMRICSLGISLAEPLSSASRILAWIACLSTALVSRSCGSGSCGMSYGLVIVSESLYRAEVYIYGGLIEKTIE